MADTLNSVCAFCGEDADCIPDENGKPKCAECAETPQPQKQLSECKKAFDDDFFELLSTIKGKTKIELLLLFLQEVGGTLQHLNAIGKSWGADIKEDRVAKQEDHYLRVVEKIKSLILKEYDEKI